ncbi:unnamed protein product [Cuscuta campestris]|uniref:Uncharacterized protein n=1 Tax=Cuscuta campestris TaxID=132261 RepID=A0A484KRX7_9ASTE|nr:unnamed protein product [Cuscuta campestris]
MMPGQVFAEREEPVNVEPAPYDPEAESWVQWEERWVKLGRTPWSSSLRILPASWLSLLEEKLKRAKAHNRELQDLTARQLDEMANLSAIARRENAEILQLKEENTQLMGEVSHLKEEVKLKEEELPGRAKQWVEENLFEAARVLTSSEENTMEGFKLLYREEHGKEIITLRSAPMVSCLVRKETGKPRMRYWLTGFQTSMRNHMAWPPYRMKSLLPHSLLTDLPGCDRLSLVIFGTSFFALLCPVYFVNI